MYLVLHSIKCVYVCVCALKQVFVVFVTIVAEIQMYSMYGNPSSWRVMVDQFFVASLLL